MTNRDKTFSGWCCVDCLFLLANGDTPADLNEAETAEYLARVERQTEGCEVTLGMFREDHGCATNWTVTDAAGRLARWIPARLALWAGPRLTRRPAAWLTVTDREYRADDAEDARWQYEIDSGVGRGTRIVAVTGHDLETESDRGGECECEQTTFSWSPCDVCGSNLGGARDAVVFWPEDEPAAAPVTVYEYDGDGNLTDAGLTLPAVPDSRSSH